MGSLIVTGASSQVGHYLLDKLGASERTVYALSRGAHTARQSNITWIKADLEQGIDYSEIVNPEYLIHVAPLWTAPDIIEKAADAGVRRIIAIGSMSRFEKIDSASGKEAHVARALMEAEDNLQSTCADVGVDWTLFRPTMIYSDGMDKNVSAIAAMIRRARVFPIAGEGSGQRMPIHAQDLAKACIQTLDNRATYNKAYNLAGGEKLAYHQMVTRIFESEGIKPMILKIPIPILRSVFKTASLIPSLKHLTPEMANRMNEDLIADYSEAAADFGFSPRRFEP